MISYKGENLEDSEADDIEEGENGFGNENETVGRGDIDEDESRESCLTDDSWSALSKKAQSMYELKKQSRFKWSTVVYNETGMKYSC